MASTYLSRTPSSAGNRKTWTYSAWFKRSSGLGVNQSITYVSEGGGYARILLHNSDKIIIDGQDSSGLNEYTLTTNRVFRDTSAWYHLVYAFDDTQSTASDRFKLYINGVQETSFTSVTYPVQNLDYPYNSANPHYIGSNSAGATYYDGSMSHIHFIDGTAYDASYFGSTDSVTGEWKINTSPSVTYGTNGFFILKDGNSVTDQSGEGNNFTVGGGTLTKTEDNPSNVFATWNPLAAYPSNTPTFSNGNNTVVGVDTLAQTVSCTLAMPKKGKFYCEMKLTQEANATSSIPNFGIIDAESLGVANHEEIVVWNGATNSYAGRINTTNLAVDGSDSGTLSSAPDVGDIMGLAVDLDSSPNTIKYYLNGSLAGTQNINNDEYVFACSIKRDNADGQVDVNFGNGYFGTTAVSTAGTNASGNGIFEYDVPTGYTALSTKGLNL